MPHPYTDSSTLLGHEGSFDPSHMSISSVITLLLGPVLKQVLSQQPVDLLTPAAVFDRVRIDDAGLVFMKHGRTHKPILVQTYVSIFLSLTIKVVYLELMSNLTTEAFVATL